MSTRPSIFDRLERLDRLGVRSRRAPSTGKRFAVTASLSDDLAARLDAAMGTTNLNASSLVRVALIKAIHEIERDGFVNVECLTTPKPRKGARA